MLVYFLLFHRFILSTKLPPLFYITNFVSLTPVVVLLSLNLQASLIQLKN